jgi:hypothetical protein
VDGEDAKLALVALRAGVSKNTLKVQVVARRVRGFN